jgi:phenylalanyl-tRNA synthetase alpha chain
MEGVRMFDPIKNTEEENVQMVVDDLKEGLEGMVKELFGEDTPQRWVDAYFPFTDPSLELEVFYDDKWMEVLGCGVIQKDILTRAGRQDVGWAFGLGLERLAMVLFKIPDIRLFWSQDDRFLSQFKAGEVTTFKPFSSHPPCSKDISFWLPKGATVADWDLNAEGEEKSNVDEVVVNENVLYHPNDLFELVREIGGDIVESVELIDEFVHPKTQRLSQCYRITYRHMARTLTNEEIDKLQLDVRELIANKLGVELR